MDEDGKRGASYTAWELVVALACCPQVPEEAALRAWELAEKGEENER